MSIRTVIDEWADRPFSYGNDCCQFAGACVAELTGNNPMKSFIYSSEPEAKRVIAQYGDLFGAMVATLGDPSDGPYKDGDITVHDIQDGEQSAGVVYGGKSIIRTEKGLMDFPLSWARAVWST